MANKQSKTEPTEVKQEVCGLIMPIAGNDDYTAAHWSEVKHILEEVIEDAGFIANMVSDAEEIGIIHNRIVTNIYNNPIVICDVSSKNPNVMFELGLRLAFDKATIIIKDDATNYTFDTGVIEHLSYPRDLRYSSIIGFKQKLKAKLVSTHAASKDPEYSTFLKSFVQYKPKLETQEIGPQEFLMKQLDNINRQLARLDIKSTGVHILEKNKPYTPFGISEVFDIDYLRSEFERYVQLGKGNQRGKDNSGGGSNYSSKNFLRTFFLRILSNNGLLADLTDTSRIELYKMVDRVIDEHLTKEGKSSQA